MAGAYDDTGKPERVRWRDRLRIGPRKGAGDEDFGAGVRSEPVARPRRRALWYLVAAVPVALLFYYPVGMALTHHIGDDLSFGLGDMRVPTGGSRSVAIAAALLQREVVDGHWVANDPFFIPASMLDNMPNFQQGIVASLARYAFELTDQIGRVRGSSRTDNSLQEAAGLLQYSGTKWVFDLTTSITPTATSEAQYTKAMRSLLAYNDRLAAGEAVFERGADNLLATLDRIALDIGFMSATIDDELANPRGWLDTLADDIFFSIKGQIYAYYLVLRELDDDFANVIAERELTSAYVQMLDSMQRVVGLDPWVVVSGKPDALYTPSHLAAQGFYVLHARTQLREITNILQK